MTQESVLAHRNAIYGVLCSICNFAKSGAVSLDLSKKPMVQQDGLGTLFLNQYIAPVVVSFLFPKSMAMDWVSNSL